MILIFSDRWLLEKRQRQLLREALNGDTPSVVEVQRQHWLCGECQRTALVEMGGKSYKSVEETQTYLHRKDLSSTPSTPRAKPCAVSPGDCIMTYRSRWNSDLLYGVTFAFAHPLDMVRPKEHGHDDLF